MTQTFNRSQIFDFCELTPEHQNNVLNTYSFEESDAYGTSYVKHISKDGESDFLPLSMFIRTDKNNFTHGIFSLTYFSAYFITLNRSNDEAVISYKYF